MQVDVINTLEQFAASKKNWQTVYDADPHAHIFVSWAWLRGYFEITPYRWFVLAAKPESEASYVAFIPLAFDNQPLQLVRTVRMGGSPIADYTGLVCMPEYEATATHALAHYVQNQLSWDRFHLKDVLDPRITQMLQVFPVQKFKVQPVEQISCPFIPLPDDWDEYLRKFMGRSERKRARRRLRIVDGDGELKVKHTTSGNYERQVNALSTLVRHRWGQRFAGSIDDLQVLLRFCFDDGCLHLPVLWHNQTPVAATAYFVDKSKKTLFDFMGGWNTNFARSSPANTLTAYTIRYAIRNGFKIYDFLRGDENYKLSYGAVERFNTYNILIRKDFRSSLVNIAVNIAKQLRQR